jgi:hypothetical protein
MSKSILVLLLVFGFVSASSEQPAPNRLRQPAAEGNATGTLRQIIPGHYMYGPPGFNSGIIVTSEGVVVLDALGSEAMARAEREAIASTTRQPVRILVSSTFHNPFSKGNVAYADALKIGHENYRTDLLDLLQREKVSAEEQKARLSRSADALSRREGDSDSVRRSRAHARRQHYFRSTGSHRVLERALFCRSVRGHQRRIRCRLGARAGCGRCARRRYFRPGTWTDSRRPAGNPARASPVPPDADRCSRRRSKRGRAGRNGGSGGCRRPMAPVRKHARIQHAAGNGRAPAVSATHREASMTPAQNRGR